MQQAVTKSYGGIRRGRVWFTTSPEELKAPKPSPTLNPKVVIRRRPGEQGEHVRRRP